jgi:transposase
LIPNSGFFGLPMDQRPSQPLILTPGDRLQLENWRDRSSSLRLAQRARIILACAGSSDIRQIARVFRVSRLTVSKWRNAFVRGGPAGLMTTPIKPRKPLTLTAEDRAQLLRWRGRPNNWRPEAIRARIILACAETGDIRKVAKDCDASIAIVYKWRSIFLQDGLAGLFSEMKAPSL